MWNNKMFSQRLYLVAVLLLHPGVDNGISKALEGLIWNAIFLQKNNLISQHVSRVKKKKVIVPHCAQSCWVIAEVMRHCCKQQQVSQPEIWNKTKQNSQKELLYIYPLFWCSASEQGAPASISAFRGWDFFNSP